MSNFWSNSTPDRKPWQPIEVVRNYYRVRVIFHIVLLLFALVGVIKLIAKAQSIPDIYVTTENGRVLKGIPEIFTTSGESVANFMDDVLAALFTRTELGRIIPDLDYAVDPVILKAVDRPFNSSTLSDEDKKKDKKVSPFVVRLIPLDSKFRSYTGGQVQTSFKVLLSTQSVNSFNSSIVYFDARWDKVAATDNNPLGYKLSGIVQSTEDLFNRAEILEEIKQRTALIGDLPIPEGISSDATMQEDAIKPANPASLGIPTLGDEK